MTSSKACVVVLLTLLSLAVTCAGPQSYRSARNGWDHEYGPLVPHETFPADCSICHVSESWEQLKTNFSFDHAQETAFPLRAAHKKAACLRCHNDFGPVKTFTARGCAGCHTDPHEAQLGKTCTQCHNESTWRPQGLIAEHARSRFPLVGSHASVACARCHERASTGDYSRAPVECAACHREDAVAATAIDHVANNWLASCNRCHYPTAWAGASFRHDFFPLSGGHAIQDCSQCHGPTIGPISRACISCHRDDYNGAPNHVSSNFPQQCEQCHNTTTWEGAVFNHRFPLVGNHNLDCAQCHIGGDTRTFSCINCHEHRRSETDDEHDDVRGYTYASAACYQCHPTGRD